MYFIGELFTQHTLLSIFTIGLGVTLGLIISAVIAGVLWLAYDIIAS
jgi:hypothetical protein